MTPSTPRGSVDCACPVIRSSPSWTWVPVVTLHWRGLQHWRSNGRTASALAVAKMPAASRACAMRHQPPVPNFGISFSGSASNENVPLAEGKVFAGSFFARDEAGTSFAVKLPAIA